MRHCSPFDRWSIMNQDGATLSIEHIFSDGFESGDVSAWSASAP
jgi:hypothetical protein